MQIRVSIIGASGYTGIELIRVLLNHPRVHLSHLVSPSNAGHEVAEIYPHLQNIIYDHFDELDIQKLGEDSDIVFLALPHGESAKLLPELLDNHCRIIDLSADLRLNDGEEYAKWYGGEAPAASLLSQAVYGLPEVYPHDAIAQAAIIANPGCYPTASILGLAPLLANALVDIDNTPLIIDAKSGVSGAGRGLSLTTHFCEVSNNFSAYQAGGIHRHIPEIEQELSKLAQQKVQIQFTPHLIPVPRGLMVTAYCRLNDSYSLHEIEQLYQEYYFGKSFVRIMPQSAKAGIKPVLGSNYCNIHLYLDSRNNYLTIVSCIDNLIKGASGQAIQNMNLIAGLNEYCGLKNIPVYP